MGRFTCLNRYASCLALFTVAGAQHAHGQSYATSYSSAYSTSSSYRPNSSSSSSSSTSSSYLGFSSSSGYSSSPSGQSTSASGPIYVAIPVAPPGCAGTPAIDKSGLPDAFAAAPAGAVTESRTAISLTLTLKQTFPGPIPSGSVTITQMFSCAAPLWVPQTRSVKGDWRQVSPPAAPVAPAAPAPPAPVDEDFALLGIWSSASVDYGTVEFSNSYADGVIATKTGSDSLKTISTQTTDGPAPSYHEVDESDTYYWNSYSGPVFPATSSHSSESNIQRITDLTNPSDPVTWTRRSRQLMRDVWRTVKKVNGAWVQTDSSIAEISGETRYKSAEIVASRSGSAMQSYDNQMGPVYMQQTNAITQYYANGTVSSDARDIYEFNLGLSSSTNHNFSFRESGSLASLHASLDRDQPLGA